MAPSLIQCSSGEVLAIPLGAPAFTPFSEYYDAYKRGYTAGEVDSILENPEGNGLTAFGGSQYSINLDAWEEAQRWGYQDGLDGHEPRSEKALLGWLDSNYAI